MAINCFHKQLYTFIRYLLYTFTGILFETTRNYNPDFQSIGKDFGLPKFSETDFIQLYHAIFR